MSSPGRRAIIKPALPDAGSLPSKHPNRQAGQVRLYIVVPVYGNEDDTRDCLTMLGEQTSGDFRVIVADDGSPKAPPAWADQFDFVFWQRNGHAGFSATCNAGAREAIRRGATHLLFLNNDTAFGRDFVAVWLQKLGEMPDALLSPIIHYFNRPSRVWFSGGRHGIHVPFFRFRRDWRELTEVDIVSGCSMLVPAAAWLALKGFDQSFPTYYEDFDLCLRAKQLGLQVLVTPDPALLVRHKVGRSSGDVERHYSMITARYLFIRRYYRGTSKAVCFMLSIPQLAAIYVSCFPRVPDPRKLANAIHQGLTLPSAAREMPQPFAIADTGLGSP